MTLPKPTADLAARRARALADATRRALLDHLQSSGVDVRTLATRTGLHDNAVRQHLAVLRDAGLVVEELDREHRVGRPRTLYRATGDATTINPFERLAALLAEVAAGADVRDVGMAEGAALAAARGAGDPADVLAHLAATQGFAVHVDRHAEGVRIVLDRCPFAAIAGPVVCGLHRAIADGVARAAGGTVTGFDIADPAVRPCELTLASTPLTEGS